jgi:D-alanyl-D-alanine carboxypeptidase/D-alanyl-D-alanine-endopeptidase (penicillin-binding protein 4)
MSRLLSLVLAIVLGASVIARGAYAQVSPSRAPASFRPQASPSPAPLGRFTPPPDVSRVLVPPSGDPAQKAKWLQAQIDDVLKDPILSGARVGVAVVDVDTGKPLYTRNELGLFNPASNVKLFTTAAALALLGPEYRWKTVVYADGPIHGGELAGRLYLKGHGDPTLVVEDLWRLVANLWENGLRKVSGDLVIDDTFFDAVRVGPGFEQKQEDYPFRAPNGALSLNYTAVGVRVLPGKGDGAPPRVVIDPATPYFTIVNEARTVAVGRTAITVESKDAPDHTEIHVGGRINVHSAGVFQERRVTHPDLYTAWAFKELCARRGIKILGLVTRGAVPPTARALSAHYSQALGVAVRDVNKHSNNFMAEQILKTLGAETGGAPGTWKKGLDAVAAFLDKLGIPAGAYKMINGSGLYDSDRFTPLQLVTLLRIAYKDFRFAADFVGSLGLAGADGTVGHRMEGGLAERYVRAKTGTLQGVSCLAGYAGAPGKLPLAFAIFMNGLNDNATMRARQAQDQIAEALVAYLLAR